MLAGFVSLKERTETALARAFVTCVACVTTVVRTPLRDELITRPEESYRLWCVVVCDLETSRIDAPYI
jgi:hypothetical protein